MARTKKQTLENASERKRQIQEEILKETLAAKKKKNVSQTPSSIKDFDLNKQLSGEVATSSGSSGMENVEPDPPSFPDGDSCNIKEILIPKALNAQGLGSIDVAMNPASNSVSSNCAPHDSYFSGGEDLPKAVICIPDICKSPSKPVEEELTFRDSYLLNTGLRGKSLPTSTDHISSEQKDSASPHSNQRSQKSPKHLIVTKKSPTCDVSASLRSLKAASEKVREEKSRKSKSQSLNSSPQRAGVTPGRRSPRHHSPVSCADSNRQRSPTGSLKDPLSANDDKPKVNIFTDSMGVELGKRIRSPRRLSDDMIALPIFSVRRWNNSPKEALVGHGSKSFDENTFHDNTLSPSKVVNQNDTFKSPASSPASSRKSGSSPLRSPNSGKKLGSDVSEKVLTTLKSGETCNTLDTNTRAIKAEDTCVLDSILVSTVKQEPISETEHSEDERFPKSYPLRKTKLVGSRELNSSQEEKSARKNCRKSDKIKPLLEPSRSKIELLMSSDITNNTHMMVTNKTLKGIDQSENNIMPMSTLNQHNIESTSSFSLLLDTSNVVKGAKNSTEKQKFIDHKRESSSDSSSSVKSHPSLLCAMLVGGTEVAHTYAQDRARFKPPAAEISDSDTDTLRASSPHRFTPTTSAKYGNSVPDYCKTQSRSVCLRLVKEENNRNGENVIMRSDSCKNSDSRNTEPVDRDHVDSEGSVSLESAKDVFSGKPVSSKSKDLNIDLSSKLKLVNENVLKLLDIDAEDGLLPVQPDVTGPSDSCLQLVETQSEENIKSGLYDLIDNLGRRLKDSKDTIPYSTPVDVDLVQKLLKSCPKSKPNIVKVNAAKKVENFEKNLSDNKSRESELEKINLNDSENITKKALEMCKNNDEVTNPESEGVEATKTQQPTIINNSASVAQSSKEEIQSSSQSSINTLSPSLNDSLCEIDLDLLTATATSAINYVKTTLHECVSDKKQTGLPNYSQEKKTVHAQIESDNSLKRTFQKSKTFDGNETGSLLSDDQSGSLRRVNSSPQMNLKMSTSPFLSAMSLNAGKETQVKSKLGSKIPVPGTSYNIRLSKKTWRMPRTIVEPKPLSILSELEEPCSQPKNVFICPNLQRYLSVPSNRMIVPTEKRNEMQEIDAKAKEKEEARQILIKERDERERKVEDEINSEFSKFEPDFDEIDGILFMSFSNEIELKAHVRVEKTLEWDKDDTMLRISRAKAFEEAKAHNEDMGDFKLKHLRGQHMRWKKYRRLYSDEVKILQDAKKKGIPIDILLPQKKTSDITKIKGWRKKLATTPETPVERMDYEYELDDDYFYLDDSPEDLKSIVTEDFDNSVNTTSIENTAAPSRSKRRQGFSHQKEHRQLFRELRMDWEDRMIHRKLGGWSLKGNRPKAFSGAAKKRQQKKTKDNTEDSVTPDTKDGILDLSAGDAEHEMFLDIKDSFESPEDNDNDIKKPIDATDDKDCCETKHSCDIKKKKMIKLIYPLLTERMARNALKTLEVGVISRSVRKKTKKERQSSSNIPALTLIALPRTPPIVSMGEDKIYTPLSSAGATVGSSPCSSLNTPQQTSQTSLASAVSTPQEVDQLEEPVMEGVEIITDNISSPSIDSSSGKSCSKPGCRYGCICHLCSVGEVSAPPPSPKVKLARLSCDKEYCRLGCICDSIDPEKPMPNSPHCGKTSCMLQCVCPESVGHDGNDDIPYLPSMKRRPKPGERFSNLPQRERTHRASKNLDAITRKAMMLYETSEIYCEKVDRVKKKPDTNGSPTATPLVSPCPVTGFQAFQNGNTSASNLSPNLSIELVAESDEDSCHSATPSSLFSSKISQAGYTSRELQSSQKVAKPSFVLDDVRQTLPNLEPSAHKRKRKSHPLSNEIFSSSTCARTQPYKHICLKRDNKSTGSNISSSTDVLLTAETSADNNTHESAQDSTETKGFQPIDVDDEPQETIPKITSVKTLAHNDLTSSQWEDMAEGSPGNGSRAPEHGSLAGNMTKSSNSSKHRSAQDSADKCSGYFNQTRQHYGWHTSMVCLKAKSPPCPQEHSEDDVQEEDEVKLLEFAANCNWEGAKKEILGKVAQCLTRGQYPQPRTMNVCEFVVEILPKAHQPSLIPPELRSKLPVQMYSIRVRITRREHMKNEQSDLHQVIDLSESSPHKEKGDGHAQATVTHNLHEQSYPSNANRITAINNSPGQANATSFGISGLSQLCISNSAQKSSCVVMKSESLLKTGSAPINRRSSLDSAPVICLDDSPSTSFGSQALNAVKRRSSFVQPRVAGAVTSFTEETPSNGRLTTVTSAVASTGVSVSNSVPPARGVTQVVVSPKDVQYVKIPGKVGVVEVIVGPSDKKLIRLTNNQSKVLPGQHVNLPVCGTTSFPSQSLLKAHNKPMESHLPGAHKSQESQQGISNAPNRSLIPTSILSTPHEKRLQSCTAEGIQRKTTNSNDEMIMVFDAAHIKALQNSKDISKSQTEQKIKTSSKPFSSVEGPFIEQHTHSAGSQTIKNQDKKKIFDRQCLKILANSKRCSGNEINNDKISVTSSLTTQSPSYELQSLKVVSKTEKDAISFVKACPTDCVDERGASTHNSLSVNLKMNGMDDSIISPYPSKTSKSASKAFGLTSFPLAAKHMSDFAPGSSKRNSSSLAEISQHSKRPRVSAENSLNIDEDSNVSLCSVPDLHIAAASPVSMVDRPKSVLSTSISTASTDDFLIMLSSEEDVDVGENDIPAGVKTKGEKPERALENDHVSLYAKENKLISQQQTSGKTHRKIRDKNLVRLEHHNKLERMRRSKLRALFDDLQQHVLKECGLPEDHSMSKANVLIEAKKVILKLCKTVRKGDAEIKNYEKANKALQERLTSLKGNKARTSESPKNVIKIVKKAQQLIKPVSTDSVLDVQLTNDTSHTEACHDLQLTTDTGPTELQLTTNIGHTEACQAPDTIDLLSPSSDDDKLSDGVAGVYEEISDPDDPLTPKIEQINRVDDGKYEDVSDPDEG